MRIIDIQVRVVKVPLTSPFASSLGTRSGTTRTVVRLRTDTGLEGLGETLRGTPTADLVERHKHLLLGEDPFELERILARFRMTPFFYGYTGYAAIAALEMACWDLMGKALEVPLARLLGGYFRRAVPATGLLTRGSLPPGVPASNAPAHLAEEGRRLVADWGFGALKVKGSHDPADDVAVMVALREALPAARLRLDPNAAWTVQQSLWAGLRLEELDLEYLEDPCAGLEGMAQVRQRIRIPLCTNMCVVRFEDFPPAVRLGAVDVVHGDVHKWGGVLATRRLGALCETFGLGMNMHSGGELGISTACHLHVAAAMPEIRYAIDSMYYLLADDIIAERHAFADGQFAVPSGPGLGVTLDEAKLERYAALHAQQGDDTL
jgi:glucarate dehydratase